MISLSACIVTKNSEHLIEKTLRSVWNVVDEIVIVDRGSSDGTVNIASKFTDRVFSFEDDDYGKIVEFAVNKATKDYIFLLNPGEFISVDEVDMLKDLKEKENTCRNGYKVKYNLDDLEENLNFNIGRIIKKDRIGNYKNLLLDWFDLENLQLIDLDIKSQRYLNVTESKVKNKKPSILIGSPIHQNSKILKEFLLSLKELDDKNLDIGYCFIDDNSDEDSSKILSEFSNREKNVTIFSGSEINLSKYHCDKITHHWDDALIEKVTNFKNSIINYCVEKEYDYLFFIDSDIILHEKTLKKLIEADKDIISNIFWTKLSPTMEALPQVWLKDSCTLYNSKSNEVLSEEEIHEKIRGFLNQLKKPGVYRVGGLGACTLIKRAPLIKGVNFSPLYNISYFGEDRHFSIRAVAYGFELYVDTNYPAYHICKDAGLRGLQEYKEKNKNRDSEIEESKILDLIREAVQAIGSMSYEDEQNNSWMKYFTIKEGSRQKLLLNKQREKVISDKIINRCRVLQCKISFEDGLDKVNVEVEVLSEGSKNNFNFTKRHEGRVGCIKENNIWLINEFNIDRIINENDPFMGRKERS